MGCGWSPMEKSRNFRIDALLAEERPRPVPSASPQGLSPESSAGSPGSCARTETPSPRAPGLLHLPPPGLSALPAMYPPPLYSIGALGGQHPAFPYPGFAHLPQPGPEHLKAAAVAGSFSLEHWIRAGMMVPRLSDFHAGPPQRLRSAPHPAGGLQDPPAEEGRGCLSAAWFRPGIPGRSQREIPPPALAPRRGPQPPGQRIWGRSQEPDPGLSGACPRFSPGAGFLERGAAPGNGCETAAAPARPSPEREGSNPRVDLPRGVGLSPAQSPRSVPCGSAVPWPAAGSSGRGRPLHRLPGQGETRLGVLLPLRLNPEPGAPRTGSGSGRFLAGANDLWTPRGTGWEAPAETLISPGPRGDWGEGGRVSRQ
uniref:Uncharacterized protein n=1 Tax=Chrysemys picta bellii TaxID=8478 RepID=A0A8C3FHB9_CHRPI